MYSKYLNSDGGVSDLACERGRADTSLPGVMRSVELCGKFNWERIRICSSEGAESIGRPIGNYDTLTLPRMDELDEEDVEDAANEVAKELCTVLDRLDVCPARLLVVGLGNRELTPDSVGPKVAARINATMHISNYDCGIFTEMECSEIAVISPGVSAQSGMDSTDLITAVCDRIMPDAVIAIDALASKSASRLGTTIQISDTGIFPGSGIGSRQKALTEGAIGIPVIAIGVPTVINARVVTEGYESDTYRSMFVSPKEIDGITDSSSKIIALGINQAFGII